MTTSGLAKLAGVDRGKLKKFEIGEDEPSEPWINRVERALDNFESETGHEQAEGAKPDESGFIRFKVEGVYGAKALVVEGPVANIAELEAAVDRILRRLAGENGPTAE
jgi:transcriptional regulator with XRE-family HTH domain